MIGYLAILAMCSPVAYWFYSQHTTLGDVGAVFIGLFCACMLILWRGRKPDTFNDQDSGV